MQDMENANIRYSIEPGVNLQANEELMEPAVQYPGRIFPGHENSSYHVYLWEVVWAKETRYICKDARNTSLIIPAVIKKIAERKSIYANDVEQKR